MESIRPRSAKVWWTLLGIFLGLTAIFGAAFYGLTREMPRSRCVSLGGHWDPQTQSCTQIAPDAP